MIIVFYPEELSWKETFHLSSPLKQSFDRGDIGDMGKVTFICRGKKSAAQRNGGSWSSFCCRRTALQDPGYLRATMAFEISEHELKLKEVKI